MKRFTVSLLALIALVVLTSCGGAGYAATLNVKLTAPYDYATVYSKASHDCWLVFEFAFSGPDLPMASVQAVVLTEQTSDHDPVQTVTPTQVQWYQFPPPPPNPMRIQYALGPGMHNGAWHVDFQYKTGMSSWQNGDADIVVQNLTITSAVDAVDGHYGFCLYDPADTGTDDGNPAHNVMRVTVDVADYPLPSYDNPTTVTVKRYDCFGIVMLREKNATINLGTQETAEVTLEWDPLADDGEPRPKGPYPFIVSATQPIRLNQLSPITYQWDSGTISVSNVSVEWTGEATAHVEWQTNGPGGATLTSTKLLAIDPGLGIQVREASHGVPNQFGSNQYDMENLLQAPANPDGKWTFLVQVKDAAGATDRAHANKYDQLKGDKAWRNWPADNFATADWIGCDNLAASFQQGFPEGGDYAPRRVWGSQTSVTWVKQWQETRVFYTAAHGIEHPIYGVGGGMIADSGTALVDNNPGHYPNYEELDKYCGDVRLAVFHGCYTAADNIVYGNLCAAGLRAGAQACVGFTDMIWTSYVAQTWALAFWGSMNGYSVLTPSWPCTVEEALYNAQESIKHEYGAYWGHDSGTCFGNGNQTLWWVG